MASHAPAHEMKYHKQQDQADGVDSYHLHPARGPACGPAAWSQAGVIGGTGGQGDLRCFVPTVAGHTLRLVDIQHLDCDQQDHTDAGMEEFNGQRTAKFANVATVRGRP